MKRCAIAILLVLSLSSLCAAEQQFEPARIVSVEKKFHERVLYYLVNTPVTQDDPYYEISVKLGDTILLTEFTPRHAADDLPDGWKDNASVQIEVTGKHHALAKLADGIEVHLLIVKRVAGTVASTAPKPTTVKN